MKDFDDEEYSLLIGNLLHDTKYTNISNMGKIAGIRKHAEVMVRKILNLGSDIRLMLGQVRKNSNNKDIRKSLEDLDEKLSIRLINTVSIVNQLGSDGTHTQHTDEFSDEEVNRAEDALLDLYAIIFIKFFLKYKINLYTSPIILHEFSFLPPIIRYKTLSYLYEIDKSNIQIVNKLCLSIIKTFGKKEAYNWLEKNAEEIREMPYPDNYEQEKYLRLGGYEIKPGLYQVSLDFKSFKNMYDLLYNKISDERTSINESGKMYKTFEDALDYYTEYKNINIQTNSDTIAELRSLIDFVYLGRISKKL